MPFLWKDVDAASSDGKYTFSSKTKKGPLSQDGKSFSSERGCFFPCRALNGFVALHHCGAVLLLVRCSDHISHDLSSLFM